MSEKVYVLIETVVGKSNEVVATLKGIEGVTTADKVTGPYDVICVVEGRLDEIGNIVTGKIKAVPGVSRVVVLGLSRDQHQGRLQKATGGEETNRYSVS